MRNVLIGLLVTGVGFSMSAPLMANTKLRADFVKFYADEDANEEFQALVKKAACYVCHVKGEDKKTVRNPYGKALHDALEKSEFPMEEYKKDPEKFAAQLKEIMKKIEEEKSGDEQYKTFGERMKHHLLPGGNVEGKQE